MEIVKTIKIESINIGIFHRFLHVNIVFSCFLSISLISHEIKKKHFTHTYIYTNEMKFHYLNKNN